MKQKDEFDLRLDEAFWEVNATASRLISYGCGVSARHLQDRRLRMQFNRELAYYAKRVVEDVYERRISPDEGLEALKKESVYIQSENRRILMQAMGVVGGVGQVLTGAGICYGSAGLLCAFGGSSLLAHGANNIYENSRGLYEERENVRGPVRAAYQSASKALGYGEREGDIAYLGGDMALSIGVLFRPVLRPDAWRLFKYYRVDKEAAVRQMSKGGVFIEGAVNGNTGYQLYDEYKE